MAEPGYYAILPATVRYDKNLTPSAKLLYAEITALSNSKGYCWASNKYFADLYGVGKNSISNWIKNLKDNGYIDIRMIYRENSVSIKERHIFIRDLSLKAYIDNLQEEEQPIQNNGVSQKNGVGYPKNLGGGIPKIWEDNIITEYYNLYSSSLGEKEKEKFKKIIEIYFYVGFKSLTGMMKNKLFTYIKKYDIDYIEDAFKLAGDNNILKISYVDRILEDWSMNGKRDLKSKTNRNKFKNFKGITDDYSAEELEEVARQKQAEGFKKLGVNVDV